MREGEGGGECLVAVLVLEADELQRGVGAAVRGHRACRHQPGFDPADEGFERAERAAERRYRNQLLRHPDPRDPDFPEMEEEGEDD